MGNQAASCALPDGAVAKVLREMTGAQRIAIADRFWFELLKVQLPGIEQATFFDRHYSQPEVLDGLMRDAYFLQLVATNEQSGNFRTFLRFWARLLHYYRTSPRDAKPCSAATILSLSVICRCLVKHFAETFSAPELLFQLEQAPHEPCGDAAPADGSLLVSYCGRRVPVRLPPAGGGEVAAAACLEPFCALVPEDSELLRRLDRCALRAVAHGETFAAVDVAERASELDAQELVVCPCGVPNSRNSVLRGVFREVVDFLVSSSFGAISGASPSLLMDGDSDGEGHAASRNLSTSPQTMQLQAVLLEIMLSLSAVIAPRYGPPDDGASSPTKSRADYSAPFLFAARERQAAARAAATRAAVKASSAGSAVADLGDSGRGNGGTEVCVCGRIFGPSSTQCSKCGASRATQAEGSTNSQERAAPKLAEAAVLAAPGEYHEGRSMVGTEHFDMCTPPQSPQSRPSKDPCVKLCFDDVDNEAPALSVPHPPAPGEIPSLPVLTAVLQVLEEEDDVDEGPSGDTGGAYGVSGVSGCTQEEEPGAAQESCGQGARRGARAEALIASLINTVWLEPHAEKLPRPPKEVVRLLSGVTLPIDDAAAEAPLLAADEKASSRAAVSAAGRLTSRALVVLLVLLFHDSQAHPTIARAFASLADPLLDVDGRVSHTAAAAPLNFTQLLRVILSRLNEGLYDLLLYCLVHRNARFRSYCLCRADADEVLVPILSVLQMLPNAVEGMALAAPPASSTALVLTLLAVTGDRSFCEGASRTRVKDGGKVLGKSRPMPDICVSSLLVSVLLRLAHWNFGACRAVFFNQAIAGIFSNLARHGTEQLHWYAASRLLEMAQLLARNMLKAATAAEAQVANDASDSAALPPEVAAAERRRNEMVRELLRALTRLISSCLRVPLVARNCALVYALQRVYPPQFSELETDAELGHSLRHVRAVLEWFQVQCPPDDDHDDGEDQIARLEAAAPRLPGAVDALAGVAAKSAGCFAFAETANASAYFLPVVWRAARQLLPDHVCWSRPALAPRPAAAA